MKRIEGSTGIPACDSFLKSTDKNARDSFPKSTDKNVCATLEIATLEREINARVSALYGL